jgi:hypothetical protein
MCGHSSLTTHTITAPARAGRACRTCAPAPSRDGAAPATRAVRTSAIDHTHARTTSHTQTHTRQTYTLHIRTSSACVYCSAVSWRACSRRSSLPLARWLRAMLYTQRDTAHTTHLASASCRANVARRLAASFFVSTPTSSFDAIAVVVDVSKVVDVDGLTMMTRSAPPSLSSSSSASACVDVGDADGCVSDAILTTALACSRAARSNCGHAYTITITIKHTRA